MIVDVTYMPVESCLLFQYRWNTAWLFATRIVSKRGSKQRSRVTDESRGASKSLCCFWCQQKWWRNLIRVSWQPFQPFHLFPFESSYWRQEGGVAAVTALVRLERCGFWLGLERCGFMLMLIKVKYGSMFSQIGTYIIIIHYIYYCFIVKHQFTIIYIFDTIPF